MKKTWPWLIVLIVVVIVLVAAGGYFYWHSRIQPAQSVVSTANWQTYVSSYGFSIKYPPDWEVDDQSAVIYGNAELMVKVDSPIISGIPGTENPAYFYTQISRDNASGTWSHAEGVEESLPSHSGVVPVTVSQSYLSSMPQFATAQFIWSSLVVPSSTDQAASKTEIAIMVPDNLSQYEKAMAAYATGGGRDPSLTWSFSKQTSTIPYTSDYIRASAQAAARVISTSGGAEATSIAYLKIQSGVAYILLNMDLDGWAGVSVSIHEIHPLVQETLLQFPQIKQVVFGFAPGDNMQNSVDTSSLP